MTEGIGKERLQQLKDRYEFSMEACDFAEMLLNECTELKPWMPIDENTPKDRPIRLFNGAKHLAAKWNEREDNWWIVISFGSSSEPFTRWCGLPDDPK